MNTFQQTLSHNWLETRKTFRLLSRNKTGLVGLILLVIMILVAFLGPFFVAQETDANVAMIYKPPSWEHVLGTDYSGRDNLIQLIYGGKDIIIVAFLTGIISTLVGAMVGSLSAFIGGWVDSLLMEIVNIWLTVPQIPLLAVIAVLVKLDSPWLLALLLSFLGWAGQARMIRAQVLTLRRRDYVEAAVGLGMGTRHVIFHELLPNMMSFILISLVFSMTSAIFQQTGLVFLGLVPFSSANWGVMLSMAYARGAMFNIDSTWNLLTPVAAIALFELSLVLFSRSLDELFNPRLRTEV
jgi:peptide/nickel transport system permease protein